MFIDIDRNSQVSIKKQLYDALTTMILDGTLACNEKLPSTRVMAEELNIARNTVVEIYEQLTAEAYLESITGKGTYVAKIDTNARLREVQQGRNQSGKRFSANCDTTVKHTKQRLDNGFYSESHPNHSSGYISLVAGHPDLNHFPSKLWLSSIQECLYDYDNRVLGYGDPKGYLPLRRTIVDYLHKHKGIRCVADQVYITNGTSGALNTIGMAFKPSFKRLVTESPGIHFVANIFKSYEYDICPVEVDELGMCVEKLIEAGNPINSLIYTTPSHQFPLGGTMPINRRQQLIDYAAKENHIIIEDDYDSEYRYHGAPVNAIQLLGPEQVIYLGTFSKTLAPGLRIGYMIVPMRYANAFNDIYNMTYKHVQTMDQYALSKLMSNGAYEKHIYKMRRLYKKKSVVLCQTLEKCFGNAIVIRGRHSGLHIAVVFKNQVFTFDSHQLFNEHGLEIDVLSDYAINPEAKIKNTDDMDKETKALSTDTLIIGFGHLDEAAIEEGVKRLRKAVRLIMKN